jgi:hypothetical protein
MLYTYRLLNSLILYKAHGKSQRVLRPEMPPNEHIVIHAHSHPLLPLPCVVLHVLPLSLDVLQQLSPLGDGADALAVGEHLQLLREVVRQTDGLLVDVLVFAVAQTVDRK